MDRAPQHGRDGIAGQRRKDAQAQTKSVEASLIRLCSVKTHHPHLSSFPRLVFFFFLNLCITNSSDGRMESSAILRHKKPAQQFVLFLFL